MFSLIILLGIDSAHLGRVDKASIPQQALMELLISGITNRDKICVSEEEPENVEEWEGVTFNEKKEVIYIEWGVYGLEGTLNLEWLPSTVRECSLFDNNLTGSIHLETLPSSMKRVFLGYNKFNGTVDLTHLPEGFEDLYLSNNQLSGSIDLTQLPVGMKNLRLSDNNFSGETDFSQLPKSLKDLFVCNTQLSGVIHLQKRMYGFKVDNSNVILVVTKSRE